ncbi:MAG: porin [Rhodocyclaceae bacterium]|nr:porin [Rhodocyclaceae bacterium]
MQKKIIALAIAGLASSAAFAQTNVTVYGKIDMSYEHSSGTGGSKTTGINSGGHDGSRLGFRGEEALGGGMKAIFGLEYGSLKADISSGLTSSRFPSLACLAISARFAWQHLFNWCKLGRKI